MKHAFITGAAGFIGRYVAAEFTHNNWHVTALIHQHGSAFLDTLAETGRLEYVSGDVGDVQSIRKALLNTHKEFDAIVHCAGRASDVGWNSGFRRTNFDSVRHLVKLTGDMNINKLVFISTTDVYGLRDFHRESEDRLDLKPYPDNPYPHFKVLAEQHIRNELPEHRYALLRPAQVWGVGDTTLTSRIVDFLRWSPWIVHFGKWHGRNRWPLAHVRNVATAAYLATILPEASGQAINVLDDEYTTIDDFYRMLLRIYLPKRSPGTITLPFWLGAIVGAGVSCISNLLNLNQPFMDPSHYAVYAVSRNLDFSNRKLKELFSIGGRKLFSQKDGIHELERDR